MTDLNSYVAGHAASFSKDTGAGTVPPNSTTTPPPAIVPPSAPVVENVAAPVADSNEPTVKITTPDKPAVGPRFLEPEFGPSDNTGWTLDTSAEGVGESDTAPKQDGEAIVKHRQTESRPVTVSDDTAAEWNSLNRNGWFPFFRSWIDTLWFKETPWSRANVFLYLLKEANRHRRVEKQFGQVITIERGWVATSVLAMAERAGRDRKTIRRFFKELQAAGEIEVQEMGQQGVLIKVLKYELYMFPERKRDNGRDNAGTTKGQRHPQRRDNPVVNAGTTEAQ